MTAQQTQLEKKHATIVCVDIHGLFGSSALDVIEQTTELMHTCHEILLSALDYHKGKFIQFTGKSAILSFEETTGKPSYPLEAIIEIKEKLAEISKEIPTETPLELQAGIQFGQVLSGQIGTGTTRQYTAIGEVVDVAVKIREMANRGQILTGPDVYNHNKTQFDFQTLEPVYIKGRSEPLAIYKVLQRKKKAFTPQDQPGRSICSEMVGRDSEKEQLISKLISLTKGNGGIINMVGSPGTGKSRMVDELKKERIIDHLLWFEGRGLSHGQTLSYHPFAGIIKSWSGIREEDNTLIAEKKLTCEIGEIYPEGVENIFPFIARFMGLTLSGKAGTRISEIEPEALDKLMLKAIRELLVNISGRKPFVIAIEDLHWADQSSLSVLRSLFELSHHHPILFINILRPGYVETTEPLIKFLDSNHTDLALTLQITNLSHSQSEELINNLILSGKIPGMLLQEIIC